MTPSEFQNRPCGSTKPFHVSSRVQLDKYFSTKRIITICLRADVFTVTRYSANGRSKILYTKILQIENQKSLRPLIDRYRFDFNNNSIEFRYHCPLLQYRIIQGTDVFHFSRERILSNYLEATR